MSILIQTIFGWPAIILSLVVSIAGILKKWPWMLVLGGVLCVPFTVYLFGFTYLHFFGFLLPFFQFGAAWAVHAKRKTVAWVLLLPLTLIIAILAFLVLANNT